MSNPRSATATAMHSWLLASPASSAVNLCCFVSGFAGSWEVLSRVVGLYSTEHTLFGVDGGKPGILTSGFLKLLPKTAAISASLHSLRGASDNSTKRSMPQLIIATTEGFLWACAQVDLPKEVILGMSASLCIKPLATKLRVTVRAIRCGFTRSAGAKDRERGTERTRWYSIRFVAICLSRDFARCCFKEQVSISMSQAAMMLQAAMAPLWRKTALSKGSSCGRRVSRGVPA
mmetsp:Transcript_7116/g.17683  ORF Transcript_7116/g.17683 Transcript_7116/m.17683 type:complete len:232 (+) Transcript_7116:1049-1744(+)